MDCLDETSYIKELGLHIVPRTATLTVSVLELAVLLVAKNGILAQ